MLWRRTLAGVLLHHRDAAEPVVLSPTAGTVWLALDAPASQDEVTRDIADAVEADADDVAGEVTEALAFLRDQRFVEAAPPPPSEAER